MTPIVFALVPTIAGSGILIGLNNSGHKGALLFGNCFNHHSLPVYCLVRCHLAVYLIGTFGSALSTIYSYNASNTSGHTKKVSSMKLSAPVI